MRDATTAEPLSIDHVQTPALLLDRAKLRRNIRRMSERIAGLGGVLRPHAKTCKSIDVVHEIVAGGNTRGITVSTLAEAEYFFDRGIADITYAVGIAPNKFASVAALIERGCEISIILDSVAMAGRLAEYAKGIAVSFKVLIELDTDGHRSGVAPDADELIAIGQCLHDAERIELAGVLTHAGESYNARTRDELLAIARQERDGAVHAAERLRARGLPCRVVSIGSTPTALAVDDLSGITEVRPGVYAFFDLVMAGIGVCSVDEIAVSVLASVIGHQADKAWAITDAGWMAMSRDRGTSGQAIDYGYGLVADPGGRPIADLVVSGANQEHGIVSSRTGSALAHECLAIGDLVRVLPNHACATSAQFSRYVVTDGGDVIAEWPRHNGW